MEPIHISEQETPEKKKKILLGDDGEDDNDTDDDMDEDDVPDDSSDDLRLPEKLDSMSDSVEEKNGILNNIQKPGYNDIVDKSVWVRVTHSSRYLSWANVSFNPIVTGLSLIFIVSFVAFTISNPEGARLKFLSAKSYVGANFTWLYIGIIDVWAVFILCVLFSKYADIRLGEPDSKPEYNDVTWFTMLFSCGVSTGLFFFGVAEPVLHYTTANRYYADSSMTDNQLAQEAINVTLFHWSIHGWVVYTLVGLQLALMTHRIGLPLTIKSIFYPLIGDKIFGWPGDLVDTMSVITTLFGVCISLGVGVLQMNGGLNILIPDITMNTTNQVIIIWIITAVAAFSAFTGVKNGIRRISEFCFTCGVIIMLIVLFMDETVFILNLFVQSVGYYFQQILKTGFHCDAFERLGPSHGAEDRNRHVHGGSTSSTDGPADWMELWTLFYMGWWVAWSPFVGMFIAKISHGRTIREFIIGTMGGPSIYIFMWMILYGGCGIRMDREAAGEGLCCHNINTTSIMSVPADWEQQPFESSVGYCNDGVCNPCSEQMMNKIQASEQTFASLIQEIEAISEGDWGFTTPNRNLTRLSCRNVEKMWFDMMLSYGDLGLFLSGFSMMSLLLYFVTSMDSGSLIMDCLASNGHPDPPPLQRILWAILEGITSTALLVAGGKEALGSLQTVSIVTGLVYLFFIGVSCIALWRSLRVAGGDLDPVQKKFTIDILDPVMADPFQDLFSKEYRQRLKYKASLFPKLVINTVTAPYSLAYACASASGKSAFIPYFMVLSLLLASSIVFTAMKSVVDGFWACALVAYLGYTLLTAIVRKKVREDQAIPGNLFEDFLVSFLFYPGVALQLELTMREAELRSSSSSSRIPLEDRQMIKTGSSLEEGTGILTTSTTTTSLGEKMQMQIEREARREANGGRRPHSGPRQLILRKSKMEQLRQQAGRLGDQVRCQPRPFAHGQNGGKFDPHHGISGSFKPTLGDRIDERQETASATDLEVKVVGGSKIASEKPTDRQEVKIEMSSPSREPLMAANRTPVKTAGSSDNKGSAGTGKETIFRNESTAAIVADD